MKRSSLLICGLATLLLFVSPTYGQPAGTGYHIIDSLLLGGEGGWDYLTVDTSAERLFVSRGMHVQVVDLLKNTVVGEIPQTVGVHGIALAPSLGKGFTSNGRDSSVTVFDLATLKVLTTVRINARNPDAILFDPFSRRVFTFNGGSLDATAIDAETGRVVGTIPLGGKPEFGVSDARGRLYVNLEDESKIQELDPVSLKVLATWPLTPGEGPTGLAIDRQRGRLYAGCGNHLLVIIDAATGRQLGTLPIGAGVDATAYDPSEQLAFSSNGEGTLTVVREETPGTFSVVGNVPTRRGARTMAVDEKTHRVYTVTAKFGPPPAPTPDRPRARPTIEPGSVTLYILAH